VGALAIENAHVLRVSTLPVFPDHRDPFDRLLVAQAAVEGLRLLTADAKNLDRVQTVPTKSIWNRKTTSPKLRHTFSPHRTIRRVHSVGTKC